MLCTINSCNEKTIIIVNVGTKCLEHSFCVLVRIVGDYHHLERLHRVLPIAFTSQLLNTFIDKKVTKVISSYYFCEVR